MSKTNSLPNAWVSPEVRLQRFADYSRHFTLIGDALVVSGFSMFALEAWIQSPNIFIHMRVL